MQYRRSWPFVVTSLAAGCGDNIKLTPDGGDVDAMPDAPVAVAPKLEVIDLPFPIDLTPSGDIALMQDIDPDGTFHFYDTATGTLTAKGTVGDPSRNMVTGISQNRLVTALYGEPVQAGLWTESGGWTYVPSPYNNSKGDCASEIGATWDVTAAGSTVVGALWNGCIVEAFTHAPGAAAATKLQTIGVPFPGMAAPNNRATKVADNGMLIGGFAMTFEVDRWPALWRPDGSGFLLEGQPEGTPGEVMAVSPAGTMAAGYWGAGNAFYWTEAGGAVNLGTLANHPDELTFVNAIAADDQLLFGRAGQPPFVIPDAFVWSPAGGMRKLQDVVTAAGLVVPEGYQLTNVLSASTDGTVVAGTAMNADFNQVSFILRLPASAYGL
ncbi:MAG: hypothetical protein SFX73_33115 [Kofleriaceae bacterium]|nr:hypothetical protein [Kofleriaceae bacterium]